MSSDGNLLLYVLSAWKETRWPGYYYRADHPKLDDNEWHCFTGSQYDPKTREWNMSKLPVHRIVEGFELLRT